MNKNHFFYRFVFSFVLCCRETNIIVPNIISSCCFNPKAKQFLHVVDKTLTFYTYNIESVENPLVSLLSLSRVSTSQEEPSVPIFMDIIENPETMDCLLLVGMYNGEVNVYDRIPWHSITMQQSFPVEKCLDLKVIQNKIASAIPQDTILKRLEDTQSLIVYCMISSKELTFLSYFHSDKRVYTLESHHFDEVVNVGIDTIERNIRVGDCAVPYQWIFDVIDGKDVWNKGDLEGSTSDNRQALWESRKLTGEILHSFKSSGCLEVFMRREFIESTIATLSIYSCLLTHTQIKRTLNKTNT